MDYKKISINSEKTSITSTKHAKKIKETKENLYYLIKKRKSKSPNWNIKDFEIGFKLGNGKFGPIYLVKETNSNCLFALKVISKQKAINGEYSLYISREINILSKLNHPNILSLYTYFHNMKTIHLILEYAPNDELYKLLKEQINGKFTEGTVARYIYQVCDAINYCHQMMIIHRDIKPENLFLDINGNIKVTGFNWSIMNNKKDQKRQTVCGTLGYLPPEIVLNCSYNSLVDNWSIGILCYELLVGYPPFQSSSQQKILNKIVQTKIFYPAVISSSARDLIMKLIKFIPDERLSLPDVMNHHWIVRFINNKKSIIKKTKKKKN